MASYSARRKEISCLSLDELSGVLAEEKNGRPNYGAILRYFRLLMGWTAAQLASLYSEALGLDDDHLITPNWIIIMENQNQVPLDEKRRWILARLLNIPPLLFGLDARSLTSDLFTWEEVDVHEYRLTLERYARGWHTGSVFQAVSDIKRRVSNLHNKAPYASEKKEMLELLCSYLILLGNLAFNHMEPEASIDYFNKAVTVATQEKFYDLWAYALRQRGVVYLEQGDTIAGLKGYPAAQRYFRS